MQEYWFVDPEVSTVRDDKVGMGSPAYTSASHVAFLTTFNDFNCDSKLLWYAAGQSKVTIWNDLNASLKDR